MNSNRRRRSQEQKDEEDALEEAIARGEAIDFNNASDIVEKKEKKQQKTLRRVTTFQGARSGAVTNILEVERNGGRASGFFRTLTAWLEEDASKSEKLVKQLNDLYEEHKLKRYSNASKALQQSFSARAGRGAEASTSGGGGGGDMRDRRASSLNVDKAGDITEDIMNVDVTWRKLLTHARRKLHRLLVDPESSMLAGIITWAILVLIGISSVTICLESMSQYQCPDGVDSCTVEDNIKVIEAVCVYTFTVEYGLKFLTADNSWVFFKGGMNMIDLISILPFYLEMIPGSDAEGTDAGKVLRIVRLARVLRIFKLGNRFGKFQVVGLAMYDSLDMLAIMCFLLVILVILFSTLIYFCEKGTMDWHLGYRVREGEEEMVPLLIDGRVEMVPVESPFASIPGSFWWCIVTLMTVGYGEIVPITTWGKLFSSIAMIASVLILALPISVIGTNFTTRWRDFNEDKADQHGDKAEQFVEFEKAMHDYHELMGHINRLLGYTIYKVDTSNDEMAVQLDHVRTLLEQRISQSTKKRKVNDYRRSVITAAQLEDQSDNSTKRALNLCLKDLRALIGGTKKHQQHAAEIDALVLIANHLLKSNFPAKVQECGDLVRKMEYFRENKLPDAMDRVVLMESLLEAIKGKYSRRRGEGGGGAAGGG